MLSVSPDYCVNMIQYYLGNYADGRFDLDGADGPFPLDLGDIMYAPNMLTDKHVSLVKAAACRFCCQQDRELVVLAVPSNAWGSGSLVI